MSIRELHIGVTRLTYKPRKMLAGLIRKVVWAIEPANPEAVELAQGVRQFKHDFNYDFGG